MTTVDEPTTEADDAGTGDDDTPDDGPSAPTGRRRRPAPRAHPFWRFVFPLLVIAAGVGVFLLWREGTKAVLDSTDGREVDLITDPAEPGYEVFVDPTPTLLAVHVDDGELVGVTTMARTALDAGGMVTLLSPDLLATFEVDGEEQGELLATAYAEGGVERVRELVEGLFGFGFLEVVEVGTNELRGVMRLVEPIPFLLVDDAVVETDGGTEVWLERGPQELTGEDAARLYAHRNPAEADAGRLERQLDLWEAWLSEIERADDLEAVTLPFEEGVPPYLRSLATGARNIAAPPIEALFFDGEVRPVYVLGEGGAGWMSERALEMVPLPVSPAGSSRPEVRLLDGTGDPTSRDRAIPDVVAAGAVVTILGNADAFDVVTTTVTHHRPEDAAMAEVVANELGATVVFDEDADAPYDLTITIGLDWENG